MSAVSTTDMPAADTRTASLTAVAAQLELALREFERLLSVFRGDHFVASALECDADDLPHGGGVIDCENAGHVNLLERTQSQKRQDRPAP